MTAATQDASRLPLDTRFLRGTPGPFTDKMQRWDECWLREVSPSRKHIKLEFADGSIVWFEAAHVVVLEVLNDAV